MSEFSKALVRCSAIGLIMTEPKGCITEKQLQKLAEFEAKSKLTDKQREEYMILLAKKAASEDNPLSDTCIKYLLEVYSIARYGRKFRDKSLFVKQVRKGNQVEEDSIDIVSRLDKVVYEKNTVRLENDFFTGEPDLFLGEGIFNAEYITDIKSAWDLETFLPNSTSEVNPIYDWQLQGYFDLTGAQEGEISHVLVDTPESLINDDKYRLLRQMDVVTEESTEFLKVWEPMERAMRFGDIPIQERRIRFHVKRDNEKIDRAHQQVERCRVWLQKYHEVRMELSYGKEVEVL